MPTRFARLYSIATDHESVPVGLGLVFVGLLGVSLWSAVVSRTARELSLSPGGPTIDLLVAVGTTSLVGFALGSIAYVRYRNFDGVRWGRPTETVSGSPALVVGLGVAPAVAVGVVSLVGAIGFDVPFSVISHRAISPTVSVGVLVTRALLPATLFGAGYAVFVALVGVEAVRPRVDSGDTAGIAAVIMGYFWLLPVDPVVRLPLDLGAAFELTVTLVFGVAFGMAVGVGYERLHPDIPRSTLKPAALVVLALGVVGVFGVITGLNSSSEVVMSALWVFALCMTVVSYERTRSLWVAVSVLAGFTTTLRLVVYLEAILGLA